MRITHGVALFAATFSGPLVTADASAQVTRIDFQVVESPAFDGQSFGDIGRYERLRGVAYGEVDPNDVRHREIVNITEAPLNARGRVEYSTTVEIYRPIWNAGIERSTTSFRTGAAPVWATLFFAKWASLSCRWDGKATSR